MRQNVRKTKGYGFTIVELLVVITLMALLVGAVGGTYTKAYKSMTLKKAAREVLLAAKYARMTAVEQQKVCDLIVDAANRRVLVSVEEWDQESGQAVTSEVKNQYWRTVTLGGDVMFEAAEVDKTDSDEAFWYGESGQERVRFRPDGTAENAVIQIGDGVRHYVIAISGATGIARVIEGVAEDIPSDTIDLDEMAG